jgi:hypothetical protein
MGLLASGGNWVGNRGKAGVTQQQPAGVGKSHTKQEGEKCTARNRANNGGILVLSFLRSTDEVCLIEEKRDDGREKRRNPTSGERELTHN